MTINIMTITMGRPTADGGFTHIALVASIREIPASEWHAEFIIVDLIAIRSAAGDCVLSSQARRADAAAD
jgi:hypothetical protein